VPQATEHGGWVVDSRVEDERRRQISEIRRRGVDIPHGPEPVERAPFRRRRENRYPPPPIRDLDRFASFDASQELAGPLPKLSDADRSHVLLIAHDLSSEWIAEGCQGHHAVSGADASNAHLMRTKMVNDPHTWRPVILKLP
jgi:hypothetical protein